jgi:exo-1,4-beta-D-glucosaminidase
LEGKLASDYFWKKCDEEGILIIAGWECCGFWEKWDKWKPNDLEIAKESLKSQLFRLRNHPSFICWIYGSDLFPPENVEREYLGICQEIYPGLPVLSSATHQLSKLEEKTGMKMSGPYTYVPPIYWYLDRMGSAERFNSEAGPDVCIPGWESINKIIPEGSRFVRSDIWNFHMGLGAFSKIDLIEEAISQRYGTPIDFKDFIKTSQILGYECWRAMFEAYARNFPIASGIIGWMGNSAWPSLIWQLFDYFYNPNGAYFGTQKALESLHLQYSYDNGSIWLINNSHIYYDRLHFAIQVFDLNSKEIDSKVKSVTIKKLEKIQVDKLSKRYDNISAHFILLILSRREKVLCRNFYWLSSKEDQLVNEDSWPTTLVTQHADIKSLRSLPVAEISYLYQIQKQNDKIILKVQLKNNSNVIAFFIRVIVIKKDNNEFLAPILWNENCISLVPFESYEIQGKILDSQDEKINILLDGWNTKQIIEDNL